jgi:hypothetical protein
MKRKTIWSVVPKDYRSTVKGKKYVLVYSEKYDSMLVPVNSKEAKDTWGKYLPKSKSKFLK